MKLETIWEIYKVFNENEGDEEEFKIYFILQFFCTIFFAWKIYTFKKY